MTTASNWIVWALLSAVFAALTAIFAKIGLEVGILMVGAGVLVLALKK